MNLYKYCIPILAAILLQACHSSYRDVVLPQEKYVSDGYGEIAADNNTNSSHDLNPRDAGDVTEDLVTILTKVPGLNVAGYGHNATFRVGGQASFYGSSDPLFVVNGSSVGSNFSNIYDTVDPRDIVSIRLLKGTDASIYGARGANGVIVIKTSSKGRS